MNEPFLIPVSGAFTEVFFSDIHFPYHLSPVWTVAKKILRRIKPDLVWLGGDIGDPQSLSRHPKKHIETTLLKEEIAGIRVGLNEVRRAASSSRIVFQEGNHDAWVARYLQDKAPELEELEELRLPQLFHLDRLGIEHVPEYTRAKVGKLMHIHGHEVQGGGDNPAKNKFKRLRCNFICGHHHKFAEYGERDADGEYREGYANACMVPLEHDWAFSTDWHWGFRVVRYARGGFFHMEKVHVHMEGGVYFGVWDGRIYEGV